jgi:hypothetical protein
MRKSACPLVLCLGLLWGCESEDPAGPGPSVAVPGKGGSGGTAKGGANGSSATGGSSPTGTGGSTPGSGGAPGSGGVSGGSGGAGGSAGSSASDAAPTETAAPATDGGTTPPAAGGYALCPKCRALFDGKNLDQWNQAAAGAWIIKDGAMASTGKAADAWTKEDFGNYRIFFSVRQISGNHQPGTLYFGNRNGDKPARGLAGIQVQPPNGYTWDYRPGKNNSGGGLFMRLPSPKWNVKQWSQCEVLVKDTGELRVACCQLPATGSGTCKGVEQLRFKDPTTAGKKSPFGIQMHNGGLFDEYKDIYVEPDPTEDDLLSIK